ncbi:MAG: EAL domain-containing protein [Lachnospiraceae bacterium]|nr:EAL domain-containing protein [Lachnospiraceae bacterium]
MVLFLTSSFIEYKDLDNPLPVHLLSDNGFVDNVAKYWVDGSVILVIAADPADERVNTLTASRMAEAFRLAGFEVRGVSVLDNRTADHAFDLVRNSDVIILAGGHAPTQNAFFKQIGLKELLVGYPGIIISLSTGSVNCAENVYIFPELEGEADDSGFERFTSGLGLTDISIIPHGSYFRNYGIDGKDLINDIILPDSAGRKFYLIEDGSYFLIDNDVIRFRGRGEVLENGTLGKIDTSVTENDWNAVMTGGYICVFEVDAATGETCMKYTSDFLNKYDVSVTKTGNIWDFIRDFAAKLVVEKERQALLDQMTQDNIDYEIDTLGSFSRTVHTEKGGIRRALDVRIRPLEDDRSRSICIIQDITEMIDRDWMTDILSRTGFLRDADKCIRSLDLSKGYSLVYTNIRGFKTINDLFGEETGDLVIFMVRDRIKEILEPLLIGRLESDHFVAIVKNESLKPSKLRQLSQMIYKSAYKQYDFSVTCGVFHITDMGISVGLMIDRAKLAESNISDTDTALYGEYTDKMRSEYVNHMILISDLGESLKQKELISFFQPIVDTRTRKIVSAESLVRWRHHDLGMVPPGLFIPALEKSGKVSRVDLYMAETVFGMLLKDAKEGHPIVPISINLSRIDFYDPSLLDRIKEILSDKDFPEGAAKIEITESAYANLERNALDFLNSMKEKKVRIMLDDYGSGLSSLSTLESYDFNTLKLDIGFIRKIGRSLRAETIIRSTISMAHEFGADVIAEGVETERQVAFLMDAKCDMIQGFYFYRPMPEEDFRDILRNPAKTQLMLNGEGAERN